MAAHRAAGVQKFPSADREFSVSGKYSVLTEHAEIQAILSAIFPSDCTGCTTGCKKHPGFFVHFLLFFTSQPLISSFNRYCNSFICIKVDLFHIISIMSIFLFPANSRNKKRTEKEKVRLFLLCFQHSDLILGNFDFYFVFCGLQIIGDF